jgi:hypothetical protein
MVLKLLSSASESRKPSILNAAAIFQTDEPGLSCSSNQIERCARLITPSGAPVGSIGSVPRVEPLNRRRISGLLAAKTARRSGVSTPEGASQTSRSPSTESLTPSALSSSRKSTILLKR